MLQLAADFPRLVLPSVSLFANKFASVQNGQIQAITIKRTNSEDRREIDTGDRREIDFWATRVIRKM
jgi:hypothetical protein